MSSAGVVPPLSADREVDADGLAVALTGDRRSAAALLAEVGNGEDDPTPRALVRAAARRRPDPYAPIRAALRDELEETAQALDRVPPRTRAALVATVLVGLTYAETAGLLDTPVATIRRLVSDAVRTSGGELAVHVTLQQLSEQRPTTDERTAAVRDRRDRVRRRRRRVTVTASIGAAALLVAAAAPWLTPQSPGYGRLAGRWAFGLQLDAPPGWLVRSHQLSPQIEVITLSDGAGGSCRVAATRDGAGQVPVGGLLDRVRIHGRTGAFVATGGQQQLTWALGLANATVACAGVPDVRAQALRLARAVRTENSPVTLPFRVTTLPAGTAVGWVGQTDGHTIVSVINVTGEHIDAEAVRIEVYQVSYGSGLDHQPVSRWEVSDRVDSLAECRTVEHRQFCVTEPSGITNAASLRRVVRGLSFVTGVSDPDRWLDANAALPR